MTERNSAPARRAYRRARPVELLASHPAYVWCLVGFLVSDIFSTHASGLGLPVGPDRLFLASFLLLIVLDDRTRLRDLNLGGVHLLALGVLTVAGLSAVAAGTLSTSLGFFALLDRLAVPYLLFALAPLALRRSEDRLFLLQVMTCIGLYLGLTAIFEVIGPHALVFPRYILDANVGIGFGRARGPFVASEGDGLTLLAATFCGIVLLRVSPSPAWRRLCVCVVPIAVFGSLLTLTRSIWLGLVVGILVLAVREPKLRRPIVVGAVIVAAVASITLLFSSSLAARVTDRAETSRSVYDRRNTNSAAIRAITAHPLTGVGWAKFIDVSDQYVRQSRDYPLTRTNIEIHNVVLSRAAELGIPGALLWIGSVLMGPGMGVIRRPSNRSYHTWRLVLTGTFASWLVPVFTSPLPYPLPNNLVWLFAGVTLTPALLSRDIALPSDTSF